MHYWLMKTEPDVFSIADLAERGREGWNGVRNYEARNIMRDRMQPGDRVIIYHSNATPPGAAGVAEVACRSYPDPDQFDPASDYYDPKSTREEPRWHQVDVKYVGTFPQLVPLETLRTDARLLNMTMFSRNRLSITPLTRAEFEAICSLGGLPGQAGRA